MRIKNLLLFLLLVTAQPAAHAETEMHGSGQNHFQTKVYEIAETGADIKVPSEIWKKIGGEEGKDTVTFSSLKIRLVEKTAGTLIEPDFEIHLPRGGGEVDLSQFVKNQTGTFQVHFLFEDEPDSEKFHAYFVSRAKKRKIDGEIWGAGCNKYMDIKSFILKDAKKKGIEVNVTRNRHDSVLGGSFVFALASRQVTQVTFTDSHQPHLFCGTPEVK